VKAFRNWPQLAKANEELAYGPWVSYHKHTGEVIIPPAGMTWTASSTSNGKTPTPSRLYRHHRPKFYRMLLDQLATIGIQVEWKHRVIKYFEDVELGKDGVVLDSGEKIEADVVIDADGLGTKSHKLED
jgi:flavin-dependent dehydrogenase